MSLIHGEIEKVKLRPHIGFSISVRATTPQEYRVAKKMDKVELSEVLLDLSTAADSSAGSIVLKKADHFTQLPHNELTVFPSLLLEKSILSKRNH